MTIGRPRKVETDDALKAAMLLFWENGYEATSLHDLLQATNLCKSRLYQLFGSKEGLFLKSLELYRIELRQVLFQQLASSSSGKLFIRNLFSEIISEASSNQAVKGCFLVNTANEFSQRTAPVTELVSKGTECLKEILFEAIERDQKSGMISSRISADSLANYLLNSICGLRTLVKAGTDHRTLQAVTETTLTLLD
ncbi:MAG: TetR/AcrR family transcriptional regulator [Burkholderiales bacterium]|nr:TetR/AcrR family transcriptional regulator [Nitrosomonas sp.]MCP5276226.1 TetR/AcrR family transcriptional regulator [Burkholderiales bacterium]